MGAWRIQDSFSDKLLDIILISFICLFGVQYTVLYSCTVVLYYFIHIILLRFHRNAVMSKFFTRPRHLNGQNLQMYAVTRGLGLNLIFQQINLNAVQLLPVRPVTIFLQWTKKKQNKLFFRSHNKLHALWLKWSDQIVLQKVSQIFSFYGHR